MLLFVILKKELAELEWVSIVLFVSLGLFIVCDIIQLLFDNRFEQAEMTSEFWKPSYNINAITSLSVMWSAYCC